MTELLQQIISDYRDNEAKMQKVLFNSDWKVIATRYATEVAKRSLEKAADNAEMTWNEKDGVSVAKKLIYVGADTILINKQSITDESNISL